MTTNEWIVQGKVEIKRGGMLRIEDGRGMLIYVWQGSVWLTQDGEGRDVVLGAGGWFRLDRKGVAVVDALAECALTLTSPYEERYAAVVQVLQPGERRPQTLYQSSPTMPQALARRARTGVRQIRDAVFARALGRTASAA